MSKIDNTPPESWWAEWKAAMTRGFLTRCGVAFDRVAADSLRLLALSHFRRGFKAANSAALCLAAYCPEIEPDQDGGTRGGKQKAPQDRGSLA